MNGAESLVHTLLASGVDTCFANPGTSEMHFVAALDRIPGMRCVLGLFEGVVTGAADGYSRIAEKPAATLLHCGPGLANAVANLHNARRAHAMVVNCVGDQATYHRPLDAPLTADTVGLSRTVSGWTRTAARAVDVGADAASAVQAAFEGPGQIATLILPSDTCWDEGGVVGVALPRPKRVPASPEITAQIARVIRRGERVAMVLGHGALRAGPITSASAIAAATGVELWAQTSNPRIERGAGRHIINRIPYPTDQAVAALAGVKHVILVGAQDPVGFFAYPNKPSRIAPPDADIHVLARVEHDLPATLAALADLLGAEAPPTQARDHTPPATGRVTSEALAQSLTALMPEETIITDESVSFGRALFGNMHGAAPHDWLQLCGGAIGEGMPLAVGAAIAAPDRRVVNLQADGSGMYTLQSLWTMARERLDVTVIILANRKYQILLGEYFNVGANPGPTAMNMLDLGNPDLDWVKMAAGMGVDGVMVETMEAFNDAFVAANKRRGPFVIELVI